jgi:hypothetical protein
MAARTASAGLDSGVDRIDRRAALSGHASLLRAPEILFCHVHVSGLLFLLLYRGEAFPFLVALPRSLRRLAANEQTDACEQSDKLKVFHI